MPETSEHPERCRSEAEGDRNASIKEHRCGSTWASSATAILRGAQEAAGSSGSGPIKTQFQVPRFSRLATAFNASRPFVYCVEARKAGTRRRSAWLAACGSGAPAFPSKNVPLCGPRPPGASCRPQKWAPPPARGRRKQPMGKTSESECYATGTHTHT